MSEDDTNNASSWGRPVTEHEPRAVRRYIAVLNRLGTTGEVACVLLGLAFLAGLGSMVAYTNFETAVLEDGTEARCLYDGETGEVYSVIE